MIRDSFKDLQYFEEYRDYELKRIKKYSDYYDKFKNTNEQKANQCLLHLSNFYKNLITCNYSIGESKGKMKENVIHYIHILFEVGVESYNEYIDALSLIILFDIDTSADNTFFTNEYKDFLSMYLVNYIQNKSCYENSTNELMFKNQYFGFMDYIVNSDKEVFKEFISTQWYNLNKDSYWYDSHKSPNDTYAGYWCWLAAALFKIKKCDVKDAVCKYVPYDLI